MGANPTLFRRGDDVPELVRRAVCERGWRPDYSRHLIATRLRRSREIIRTPQITGRFFFVDIENRRPDVAAYDTVARLEFIPTRDGERRPSPNRSPLKVTGQWGYRQVIWPRSHGALDVFAAGAASPSGLYLHTALDLPRIDPFVAAPGQYDLEYAVLARDFPVLRFTVAVTFTGNVDTTEAALRESSE
jgi:hypothetical protein